MPKCRKRQVAWDGRSRRLVAGGSNAVMGMAGVEVPEGSSHSDLPLSDRATPLRSPWMAPIVALALMLVMAVGLEVFHRHELQRDLGRLGVTWSPEQGRAFATADAWVGLGQFRKGAERLEAVAQRWPEADVAAAAWWHASTAWAWVPDGGDERLRWAEEAAEAARPESESFAFYCRYLAMVYLTGGDVEKGIAALREGLERSRVVSQRGTLLGSLIHHLRTKRSPEEALREYEDAVRKHPRLSSEPHVLWALAKTYLALEEKEKARRLLERLARSSESDSWRRRAQRELEEIGRPVGGN